MVSHKLQNAVKDMLINCLGGIFNYAVEPFGKLITIEFVLEEM